MRGMIEMIVSEWRKEMEEFRRNNKGALNNLVGAAIGIVILAIVVFNVAIPTVTDAIATAGLNGSAATLAELIPLFMVLGVFVIVIAVFVTDWL